MTNRKSRMHFRLVPKSMTLDDLEVIKGQILSKFCATSHFCARQRCSSTPVQFDAPAQGNRRENLHTPYIFGNWTHWATFLSLTLWVYLHSFNRFCLPKMRICAKFRDNFAFIAAQGHPMSSILVPMESAHMTSY